MPFVTSFDDGTPVSPVKTADFALVVAFTIMLFVPNVHITNIFPPHTHNLRGIYGVVVYNAAVETVDPRICFILNPVGF